MSPDGDRRSVTFRSNALDEVYLVYSPLAMTTWIYLCNPGPMTASHNATCTSLFWQCLEGIEYIHSKGVMHRDIKPGNLVIVPLDPPQGRVTDFGCSKLHQRFGDLREATRRPILIHMIIR